MIPGYSDMVFTVKGTDCSEGGKLLPNMLLSYLQETADKGANDCGYDRNVIRQFGASWIILRIRMEIKDLPRWRESFRMRTWSTGVDKFFFDREYEVYNDREELICQASSVWIMADIKDHRPIIPSRVEELGEIPSQGDRLVFGSMIPRKKMPPRDSFTREPDIIKYADYSDIDHNHHVNNTRYLAWACDAWDKTGVCSDDASGFTVYFESEVKKGEKIELFSEREGNTSFVSGYSSDGRGVFSAEITLP